MTASSSISMGLGVPRVITLSRILEVPSLVSTFKDAYSYIFSAATCFGLCWPSSSGIHNYCWKRSGRKYIRINICKKLLTRDGTSNILDNIHNRMQNPKIKIITVC
jgi:hypothetical protein